MVVPLFAGNLQHPSSKFASRYGHLKTISERCKNHTPTTSMCNHPHSSLADETAITAAYRRSWAPHVHPLQPTRPRSSCFDALLSALSKLDKVTPSSRMPLAGGKSNPHTAEIPSARGRCSRCASFPET